MSDILSNNNHTVFENSIVISNAGLVLLNSFFSILFKRLELIENNNFKNKESQIKAVHFLQYLASGNENTEEAYLTLNKVLCGIPITNPIYNGIVISPDQKTLIDGLLKAAINYWPEIGTSSIDGFRGNWLIRQGLLSETQEHWLLTVEKRAYDILIIKSPFSFSIIHFPWMVKPLLVNWEY